jgi:hypothetical protein
VPAGYGDLVAGILAVIAYIALMRQAAWANPSHFNLETTFDSIVARVLAGGGVVLVAIIIVLAFSSVRANPAVPMSLRIAIRIGFLSLVGAVLVGR